MSDRRARIDRARARGLAIADQVRSVRPIRAGLALQRAYGDADANLLAAGLAYGAIFAVISGLLLLVSVLVLLGDTPTAREDAIVVIVERLPPLEPFARTIVYGLADGARVGTLVGLIAFAWGASGFYLSLHGALDRVMPSERRRSSIVARIHGLLAVGLVVAAILASIVAGSLAAVEQVGTVIDRLGTLAILGPLVTPGLNLFQAVLVVIVVLRFVPTDPPPIRVALPGSIVAGVGIGLLTALFGLLAPFLVGELAGLGVIASVFIALIWFSWTFRILLYGAAIAGVRRDAARAQDPSGRS